MAPSQAPAPADSPIPGPSETASIHGLVTDRDGAVYEGVHITLARLGDAAKAIQNATTDNVGAFRFAGVGPGPFQISVEASGFATQMIRGVLRPGESLELPAIVLLVSSTTTEVQVNASTQMEIAEAEVKEIGRAHV